MYWNGTYENVHKYSKHQKYLSEREHKVKQLKLKDRLRMVKEKDKHSNKEK